MPLRMLSAATLAIALTTGIAAAAGSADVSASVSGFSSPSRAYGPWVFENLDVQLPPSGNIGLHLENRRASDRYNSGTHQLFGVDAYRSLTHTTTLYAGAWFGTGAPYPRERLTLEADVKAGHGFVPFAGGSIGSGYGIGATRQLYAGLYYYFKDDYLAFRYSPSWSPVLGSTRGYQTTLALGHPGRTTETLRVGSGGENDVSLVSPINPTIVGEREFDASVSVKHWTSKGSGYHVDVLYGALDRSLGSRIYARTSIGGGVFFSLP